MTGGVPTVLRYPVPFMRTARERLCVVSGAVAPPPADRPVPAAVLLLVFAHCWPLRFAVVLGSLMLLPVGFISLYFLPESTFLFRSNP